MPHLPAQELYKAGDEKAGVSRVLGQGMHRRNQFRREPLIGVQVQLPGIAKHQVVDRPVSLRAIVLEGMLNGLGPMLPAERYSVVCAEGVDDVEVVGDFLRGSQRCP